MVVAPSLAYIPRLFDRWPGWVEGAVMGGLGSLLLCILAFAIRRTRRRS